MGEGGCTVVSGSEQQQLSEEGGQEEGEDGTKERGAGIGVEEESRVTSEDKVTLDVEAGTG